MEDIFTNIYESEAWGDNNEQDYRGSSGEGSDPLYNKYEYVPFLREFLKTNQIKRVVDLGCGDFRCGPYIYDDLELKYIGYDAYSKVVEYNSKTYSNTKYTFYHLDFCSNPTDISNGDVCILKDVLQHWPLAHIYTLLDSLVSSRKFKYILICNCCNQTEDNTDIDTGRWHALHSKHLPLRKYNAKHLMYYKTKEVSVIDMTGGGTLNG